MSLMRIRWNGHSPLPRRQSRRRRFLLCIGELEQEEKKPVLLHGVTGSGKTEIYMQIIAEVLTRGEQAIVLVPEIALTPLLAERFVSRFGDAVSVTHSRLSMGERVDQWKKARDGEISVVIGARSALFLPFPKVGAIIMDEAHENSYVSDITPKYDTKDVAAALAKRYGALFLMGTATPDFISYYKAKQGEFLLLELKERTGGGVRRGCLIRICERSWQRATVLRSAEHCRRKSAGIWRRASRRCSF